MESIDAIALSLGAAWASGINLYAAVLVIGWLGASGQVALPAELSALTHPLVLAAAGLMYLVEFFADKIPGLDSAWDILHTFVRIPAGALLAAGAASGLDAGPFAEVAGLLLGGGLSAASHATKAGSRVLINASPEPVSNWSASLAEDVSVFAGLWAALHHPWVFIALLTVFLLLAAWLLPRLWRALLRLGLALRAWFGADRPPRTGGSLGAALRETSSAKNGDPSR